MQILQKWQQVKVVKHVILNMMAIFTGFVNVHVMTELQEGLLVRYHNHLFSYKSTYSGFFNVILILIL